MDVTFEKMAQKGMIQAEKLNVTGAEEKGERALKVEGDNDCNRGGGDLGVLGADPGDAGRDPGRRATGEEGSRPQHELAPAVGLRGAGEHGGGEVMAK